MATLTDLKGSLCSRTSTMETILSLDNLPPVQNLAQHMDYTDCVERLNKLYFEATSTLVTIELEHRNYIDPTELATLKTLMANI